MFKYLYDMMDTFGPLMDKWASGERRHVGNEDDDQVRTCRSWDVATLVTV